MRRRTKPRVVWIPTTPQFSVDGSGVEAWNLFSSGALDDSINGTSVAVEVPVVLDGTQSDPLNVNSSLADIENSGYRLRRIVGKIFVFVAQTNPTFATLIGVTAGFMVRRVDGTTGNSLAGTLAAPLVSPSTIDNSMDPWIWRRSWLLQNGPTFNGTGAPVTTEELASQFDRLPGNNVRGGSAVDGPHIDQKTARVVGPEERLFLDVSATVVTSSGSATGTSLVVVYEARVLGSMKTSSGNRRNASR